MANAKLSVNLRWYKGITSQKAKDEFRSQLIAAAPVLEKLKTLLAEDLNDELKNMRKKENYSNAKWEYLIADSLGAQRVLHDISDLIPTNKQE